jgi:hypothetical protein
MLAMAGDDEGVVPLALLCDPGGRPDLDAPTAVRRIAMELVGADHVDASNRRCCRQIVPLPEAVASAALSARPF